MSVVLALCLMLAAWLFLGPASYASARFRRAVGSGASGIGTARPPLGGRGSRAGSGDKAKKTRWWDSTGRRQAADSVSLTLVVQQLAALLKGGRTPGRLWDELWMLYCPRTALDVGVQKAGPRNAGGRPVHGSSRTGGSGGVGPGSGPGARRSLSPGSGAVLAAARAAALRGAPVSDAIRSAVPLAFPRAPGREPRVWGQLAACFDIAEASGCPLADVLTRFAAQLEVEDDADAARQTALAGPRATVSLLTWLPLMGLGLGAALGVDPLAILVGTPLGMASLTAGVVLTVAGRIWSARLVRAAAGAGVP